MKLNKGSLIIESLIALLVCALVISGLFTLNKTVELERDIYLKHEKRVYEP